MHDLLPPASARRDALVESFAEAFGRAGFGRVDTPLLEDLRVFQRVGEGGRVGDQAAVPLPDRLVQDRARDVVDAVPIQRQG